MRRLTITAALAVTLALAGCGMTSTLQDLEGVHAVEPDQFPNVSVGVPRRKAAGVAFFMKQLGGRTSHGGDIEQFPADLRVREFPESAAVTT